ncbi:unnamed protein product [Lathyrus sativus]|nr:unnamed protein product [Lathyrus sativus]
MGDIDWRRVRSRRDRNNVKEKWDAYYGDGGTKEGEVNETHFIYFSEIPKKVKAEMIFNLFREYDNVKEVVIPPKRNKLGKRFGFVRFTDIDDVRVLALKLDNIFIDSVKIHANIPRFPRLDKGNKGDGKMYRGYQGESGIHVPFRRSYGAADVKVGTDHLWRS